MRAFTFRAFLRLFRSQFAIGLIGLFCLIALPTASGAKTRPPVEMGDPDDPYQGPKPAAAGKYAPALARPNYPLRNGEASSTRRHTLLQLLELALRTLRVPGAWH